MISNMDFLAEIIFFNNNRQAEGWHKKEVDLVHGFFPFVCKVFFFRESYE